MKLHILICSTRPTRKGPAVASWFRQYAATHGKFESELVDIAAFDLPVFDEPEHPAKRQYVHEHTKNWSASVDAADAFVFVMPEYNHHTPPALLNAMTYVYHEWTYKPVGFVSYAGLSGGLRAVETTRQLVGTFRMVPVVEQVAIPFFEKKLDKDDVLISDEKLDSSAKGLLDELHKWSEALKPLRLRG